jgi:hypothetical protein
MNKDTTHVMSDNFMRAVVREISHLESLSLEVQSNYAENRWWPTTITDIRLRLLLAGWTTRLSYRSIKHYQAVVARVRDVGFDTICKMPDSGIVELTKTIGLPNARLAYLRSLASFINTHGVIYCQSSNIDEFIETFARSVDSASFKVGQCAALYARGYHCGIIPVDSGMCDMLAPIVPVPYPHNGIGHEIVRKRLEEFTRDNDCFMKEQSRLHKWLSVPNTPATWWLHLLLIYYKRLYWNLGRSNLFCRGGKYEDIAIRSAILPDLERYPFVIIEGVDGVGKTTLSNVLVSHKYLYKHSSYNKGSDSLSDHYETLITNATMPTVFDRFFLSEYVYGKVFREKSRVSFSELDRLCSIMRKRGFVLFLVTAPIETILQRRPDLDIVTLKTLLAEYRKLYEVMSPRIPTYWLDSSTLVPSLFPAYLQTTLC